MDEKKPQSTPDPYEPNRALQTGMYVLAVLGGVATASFKVWDQFYSKMKHTDLIGELGDKR